MNIGFYAGSFSPFTNGHLHVVKEASKLFDKVVIGIGINSRKTPRYDNEFMKGAIDLVLKRVGDVFFATGGIVAGASFMIFPITSLTNYPAFHFISIQSFVLHATMVVVGFIINRAEYIEYDNRDFKYFFGIITVCTVLAYIVNLKLGTNLMFISQNFPGTLIEPIYNSTGKLFPLVMFLPQATLPFFIITYLNKKTKTKKESQA